MLTLTERCVLRESSLGELFCHAPCWCICELTWTSYYFSYWKKRWPCHSTINHCFGNIVMENQNLVRKYELQKPQDKFKPYSIQPSQERCIESWQLGPWNCISNKNENNCKSTNLDMWYKKFIFETLYGCEVSLQHL